MRKKKGGGEDSATFCNGFSGDAANSYYYFQNMCMIP